MCIRNLEFNKILIAEDDDDTRELLIAALQDRGFEVSAAGDGSAALDLIDAANRAGQPYDAVILDWAMSPMPGLTAAIKIREKHAVDHAGNPVKLGIFTAHSDLGVDSECRKCLRIERVWDKPEILTMLEELPAWLSSPCESTPPCATP